MNRSSRQKLAAVATVAVLLAGGTVWAVTAVGEGGGKAERTHARVHRMPARDLAAAADYLGISAAELQRQLQSGRSLGQIAAATPGKSEAGLIDALVARKRKRLDVLSANLSKRVGAEVNRSGGQAAGGALRAQSRPRHGRSGGPRRAGVLAAAYLGVSPAQLRRELRGGKTLAEVAAATPGKSAAGLIDALLTAWKARLHAAVASGAIGQARADMIAAKLNRRATILVNRRRRTH
jgi:hypothetical protein